MSYLQNMSPSTLFGGRAQTFAPTVAEIAWPVGLLAVGMLVGAGLALMLTPKTGREMRGDLSRQASRIGDAVRHQLPNRVKPIEHDVVVDGWHAPAINP
ncbi:MAG: YtxH domain-containing protein [Myxococcota bacterium]